MTACAMLADLDQPSAVSLRSRRSAGGTFLVIVCLLVACLTRTGFLAKPFHNDAGLYVYMGKVVASGGVLYRDFYENKPPGVGLLMAPLWKIFGPDWIPYVYLQLVLALGAAALLARAVARCVGEHGRGPTLIFGIVLFNFCWVVFTGFQLETVQAFFAVLAACAALEAIHGDDLRDSLTMGLAAGVAAMIKPTGMSVLAAAALGLVCRSPRLSRRRIAAHLAIAALAALIPNAGVALWVWRSGLMPRMPHLFHEIALYGSQTPLEPMDWLKLAEVVAFLGLPMMVRGWVFRREPVHPPRPGRGLLIFAIFWFLIEALGVFLQGRMYAYHFMVILPPAALLYGLMPRTDRWIPIALGLMPISMLSLWWCAPTVAALPKGLETSPVSEYLRAHTAPTDTIYADQYPRIVFESGRDFGSRYGTLFYFVNHDEAPLEYGEQFLDDLNHRRPEYFMQCTKHREFLEEHEDLPMLRLRPRRLQNFKFMWARIDAYLQEHYFPEVVIEDNILWRRRDQSARPSAVDSTEQARIQPQ